MDSQWACAPSGHDSREMQEIIVIGGGGHARVIISILRKLKKYSIRGYTDELDCGELLGIPYLGADKEIASMTFESAPANAVLAVGQIRLGKLRHSIWSRLNALPLIFPKIVSPNAIVNEDVAMGDAVVVMDGAIINTGAKLGTGVIVNTHSTVEHDVTLADWVHVAPGATISGGTTIGRFSLIGAGATVTEGKSIAAETIIGAGATVVHDLAEPGVYVGTPARRIK
jgi:sugar O-acyltransferase (sialic acid O-acetyltransferase NeuD family)